MSRCVFIFCAYGSELTLLYTMTLLLLCMQVVRVRKRGFSCACATEVSRIVVYQKQNRPGLRQCWCASDMDQLLTRVLLSACALALFCQCMTEGDGMRFLAVASQLSIGISFPR